MNISLRQVKTDSSQTMFITSSGTVLFTSYLTHDQSTTLITSIDTQGSLVQVGCIKWNENSESYPAVYVMAGLMSLLTTGQGDAFAVIFRGSDRQMYRWKKNDNVLVLSANGASLAPIAMAYGDIRAAESITLCIQPTGFHILDEIVATFLLFERLCGRSSADNARCKETRIFSGDDSHKVLVHPHEIPLAQSFQSPVPPVRLDICVPAFGLGMRHGNGSVVRFAADLTGELVRRYKYPSAYGGFGDIWKCEWLKDSRVIEVAVKVMRTNLTGGQGEIESKRICRELKVWVKLEHVCVLPLYGISFDFGIFPAMVCPWLEGGTLSKYLEDNQGLQLNTRLRLLSDVADGLQYLHGCGIVHGDLTGSNVLIKDNGKLCLSDFGLSRILTEATGSCYLTSTIRGSVRWAAPELFEIDEEQQEPVHILPNTESDIYSFGSTMLQVLTGKVPYHYYKYDAQVLVALSRGARPTRPDDPAIDELHWEFMHRCWSDSRSERRPSIEEVVDFLSVTRCR